MLCYTTVQWETFEGENFANFAVLWLFAKMSLLSLSGSVLIKTMRCTRTVFLSKQVLTIVAGRRRDAQTIEILGAYTLLR